MKKLDIDKIKDALEANAKAIESIRNEKS